MRHIGVDLHRETVVFAAVNEKSVRQSGYPAPRSLRSLLPLSSYVRSER